MSDEVIMSDEKTIMDETARLMNLIGSIEETARVNELKLTDVEMSTLEKAKLRLREIEIADRDEVQRVINDSILAGEGLFLKEQYREIVVEKKKEE